jgi:hypothetical protein
MIGKDLLGCFKVSVATWVLVLAETIWLHQSHLSGVLATGKISSPKKTNRSPWTPAEDKMVWGSFLGKIKLETFSFRLPIFINKFPWFPTIAEPFASQCLLRGSSFRNACILREGPNGNYQGPDKTNVTVSPFWSRELSGEKFLEYVSLTARQNRSENTSPDSDLIHA